MPGLNAISEKLEKFITERDSFRNAVSEAFQKADVDGNRVIAPKEVAAISETMFDLVEKELNDYGIAFQRPTPEQVKTFLEIADRNNDYVLNEEEFFEFYRQVTQITRFEEKDAIGRQILRRCWISRFSSKIWSQYAHWTRRGLWCEIRFAQDSESGFFGIALRERHSCIDCGTSGWIFGGLQDQRLRFREIEKEVV